MTPTRPPRSPVGRQILWIITAIILCIVVPLVLHETTGGGRNVRSPWWALAIIVLSGACYAAVIASRKKQLFGMVLWLFTYIFMGLAPYVQYRLALLPSTTPTVDQSLFPAAGVLVIASVTAVIVGSIFASRRPVGSTLERVAVDPQRVNILTMTALAVFLYYGQSIGFGAFLLSRTELSALRAAVWPNTATMGLLTGGLHMLLLVGFIAQMTARQQAKASHQKPAWLLPLINGLVLLYTVNPVSSPRYVVGTVVLAMLATFGVYATLTRFRIMAAAALVGMLTLFPLADLFRHTTDSTAEVEGPVQSLTSGDFDAFMQLTNTLQYVNVKGLSWGDQLLGVLLFWVPRAVWPGKPLDTGVELAEYMGYRFTNLSSPIWSELFINFGWVGTIAGMGLLGYFFRRWDTRTDLYLRTSRIPPVIVCAVAFYLLIVLRGSLLNAASYLLVILLASWFVVRAKHKPSTSSRIKKHESKNQGITTSIRGHDAIDMDQDA